MGLETIFVPNAVTGSRNATIHSIVSNDQHGTIMKKKGVTINDNTGWMALWGDDTSIEFSEYLAVNEEGATYVLGDFTGLLTVEINGKIMSNRW